MMHDVVLPYILSNTNERENSVCSSNDPSHTDLQFGFSHIFQNVCSFASLHKETKIYKPVFTIF